MYFDDDFVKVDDMITLYQLGEMDREELIRKMEHYTHLSHGRLIETVNEVIKYLKEYASNHSEFNPSFIEEQLENVMLHPESFQSETMTEDNIYLKSFAILPKEVLKSLYLAITNNNLIAEINQFTASYGKNVVKER